MRAVVVFVGGGRNEAQRPVTTGRRSEAAEVAFRAMSPGGGNAVVTGRKSGLAASRAKGFAKKIVGARVMTRC